jgi:hypothetical protein
MIIGALPCFISLLRANVCLEDIGYAMLEARYYSQGVSFGLAVTSIQCVAFVH